MGVLCLIAMAKKVIGATVSRLRKPLGIDKDVLAVRCDDGTVYAFERGANSPRWRSSARYAVAASGRQPSRNHDSDEVRVKRSPEQSRLPRAVEAHMDGRTCSGPEGPDAKDYWV